VATPVETVIGAARSRSNSVEERRSPSDDSIRERSVERELSTNIFGEGTVTDDMRNLGAGEAVGIENFRFLFAYK
jgi:hypothetical protein